MDVIHNGTIALVYVKLSGFLLIGYIHLLNHSQWKATRVHVRNGWIQPQKFNFPYELWQFIQKKAQRANQLQNSISDIQKNNISESYTQQLDAAMQSRTWESLEKDIKLFGIKEIFKENDTKI